MFSFDPAQPPVRGSGVLLVAAVVALAWAVLHHPAGGAVAGLTFTMALATPGQAEKTAFGTWVRSLPSRPDLPHSALPPQADLAVAEIAHLLNKLPPGKVETRLQAMKEGLT